MQTENPPRGTTAHSPDLNWSQVRETVLMLELAAAQIEAAMKDSNASVEVLTASFTAMAETMGTVSAAVAALPQAGAGGDERQGLLDAAGQVSAMVHSAVIAFQFYDKLAQRLDHVTQSLGSLSDLVSDQRRLFNPQEWADLQQRIRGRYTTVDENRMFDAVMSGTPVAEAIAEYVESMKAKTGDDIELF